MLLPFDWAVITLNEAKILVDFIEKSTATPKIPINYEKMSKVNILEMYDKLKHFITNSQHYKNIEHIDLSKLD